MFAVCRKKAVRKMPNHRSAPIPLGSRFTRWEVVGETIYGEGDSRVPCKCDCGTYKQVLRNELVRGGSPSCGCLRKERLRASHISHGLFYTPIYRVWSGMINRCNSPISAAYKNYGGRGITVCPEWQDVTVFAKWAQCSGYSEELEIDRTDNNAGYSPENCRWVTKSQNCRNRRSSSQVTIFGENKCLADWAEDERCSVAYSTLECRLRAGWKPEIALTKLSRLQEIANGRAAKK